MAESDTNRDIELPSEIFSRLDAATLEFVAKGRVGNVLYKATLADGSAGILNVGEGAAAQDVRDESERLSWLDGRVGAPPVVSAWAEKDRAILVVGEIPGRPLHACVSDHDIHELIRLYAHALRAIHQLPSADCPFDAGVSRELESAAHRVAEARIDITRFKDKTGQSPAAALAELRESREIISDPVFTHGDFALPNVIMIARQLGGVVDWSQAGVSGRNRDFMSAETSIARNCGQQSGDQLINEFYHAYGRAAPDRQQIQYFWKLDQFWTHGR